jgi:hypothetical protein
MLSFLKNHPFAVEAFFERSIVLTFAFPKEKLQHFIPECLSLDTFDDKWAFVAMALVQTKNLRPKGFPEFMGNDFFLIGYRVFVKYIDIRGRRLRGLYILKSETDNPKMEFFGNIFTHYNYDTTDINYQEQGNKVSTSSAKSGFNIELENAAGEVELPEQSPFSNWKEARRFAGPLPFTFTYEPASKKVLIIEGVRENWDPAPVKVINLEISFFKDMNLEGRVLANAFMISNIPYMWKKGRIENWKG